MDTHVTYTMGTHDAHDRHTCDAHRHYGHARDVHTHHGHYTVSYTPSPSSVGESLHYLLRLGTRTVRSTVDPSQVYETGAPTRTLPQEGRGVPCKERRP